MGVIPTVPILPGTAVNRLYVVLKCRWVTVDNRPAPDSVRDRLNHDTHTFSQTETWPATEARPLTQRSTSRAIRALPWRGMERCTSQTPRTAGA